MVSNQPACRLGLAPRGSDHRLHEVVVGVRLVGKAPAVQADSDHARFRPVDEMRHDARRAVLARHQRHGRPCRGIRQALVENAAYLFGHAHAIAHIRLRRGRVVAVTGLHVRVGVLAALEVVWESAAGQDDTVARLHADPLPVTFQHGARDPVALVQQPDGRRRQPDRNRQVRSGFRQARGQRVAVGQRHPPSVLHHLEEMLGEAFGDIPGGFQRPRDPHEVDDLLARADRHAEDGQFRQHRAERFEQRAQLARVIRARHHRAAALRGAGRLRVVVRERERHVELDGRLRHEERDGLRAVRQEGTHTRFVERGAGLVSNVGEGLIRQLVVAVGLGQMGIGNP